MAWQGHLQLTYQHDGQRTTVHDRHSGPLRILKSLYPEGPQVCHNVVVHPPAGIAGGDELTIDATLGEHTHALVTTPGATRFYRSHGELALQTATVRVAGSARFEWLPLETICHRSTNGENRMRFELSPGAEMMGWDVLALGLPASGEAFDHGRFTQQIELPGVWLERGTVDGAQAHLLDSPIGWAGHRVMATMWFASGSALDSPRRESLLDVVREAIGGHALRSVAGATSPHAQVVVLRALAHRVEPAMGLLVSVWQRWRRVAWGLGGTVPRVWRT
jgi:urease accessory protein